ncbi:hypothetical protein HMPREF9985_00395, partial [Staphylococcus epidermidis NIHLM039]
KAEFVMASMVRSRRVSGYRVNLAAASVFFTMGSHALAPAAVRVEGLRGHRPHRVGDRGGARTAPHPRRGQPAVAVAAGARRHRPVR